MDDVLLHLAADGPDGGADVLQPERAWSGAERELLRGELLERRFDRGVAVPPALLIVIAFSVSFLIGKSERIELALTSSVPARRFSASIPSRTGAARARGAIEHDVDARWR
jgi:hypothetical protein